MAGIKQPLNKVISTIAGKVELKFNSNFANKWNGKIAKAQKVVDSEVLRLSEKYTPLLTGTLKRTGDLGTVIGSGKVSWIAPYAKKQYYKGRKPGTSQTGSLRGRYWFHRMKEVHKNEIINTAKKKVSEGDSGGNSSSGQSSSDG